MGRPRKQYGHILHCLWRATSAAAFVLGLLVPSVCLAEGQLARLPDVTQIVPAQSSPAIDLGLSTGRIDPWFLEWLPDGLIYHSYLAGMKEPRFASSWVHERELGWIWDITLGGRMAILRYGTPDPRWPEGWEIDIEGAAFPRLDPEEDRDLVACDYRFGVPLTYGRKQYRTKLAYYHLSSHLGDEFMIKNPTVERINYRRAVRVGGNSLYLVEKDLRLYVEAGWAFHNDGGSRPWEFQLGFAYSSARPTGSRGAPFLAVNGHLRQEVDFGGNLVVEAGWQWRGETGRLLRLGSQYYTGMSEQYEFFNRFEDKVGFGIWYDY